LRGPEGGFACALDADSEGVEGRYYVWSLDELRAELGDLADEAIAYFGATERGNFEGANVLEARGPEHAARAEIRQRLREARWPTRSWRASPIRPTGASSRRRTITRRCSRGARTSRTLPSHRAPRAPRSASCDWLRSAASTGTSRPPSASCVWFQSSPRGIR